MGVRRNRNLLTGAAPTRRPQIVLDCGLADCADCTSQCWNIVQIVLADAGALTGREDNTDDLIHPNGDG
jgi:hypothetical protein